MDSDVPFTIYEMYHKSIYFDYILSSSKWMSNDELEYFLNKYYPSEENFWRPTFWGTYNKIPFTFLGFLCLELISEPVVNGRGLFMDITYDPFLDRQIETISNYLPKDSIYYTSLLVLGVNLLLFAADSFLGFKTYDPIHFDTTRLHSLNVDLKNALDYSHLKYLVTYEQCHEYSILAYPKTVNEVQSFPKELYQRGHYLCKYGLHDYMSKAESLKLRNYYGDQFMQYWWFYPTNPLTFWYIKDEEVSFCNKLVCIAASIIYKIQYEVEAVIYSSPEGQFLWRSDPDEVPVKGYHMNMYCVLKKVRNWRTARD